MSERVLYFFIIGCVVGWLLEAIFKIFSGKSNTTPGILQGPFCILYGVGLTFLAVILSNYSNNIIVLFILSAIFLTLFEYLTGVLLEKIYNIKLWDYSEMKFKLNDKVCLEFSLIWGALGVVFIKFILPTFNTLFLTLQGPFLTIVLMATLAYILIDFTYSSAMLLEKKNEVISI